MIKKPKKRRRLDLNELAFETVRLATQGPDPEPNRQHEDPVSAAAATLSKRGASKGGKARARLLTEEQRKEIAQTAAQARWKKR